MTAPVSLHKLLLVGTGRAPLPADLLEAELAAIASPAIDLPGIAPERRLWLAAGATDLWSRAGHVPPPPPGTAQAPSAPEQLAACPVPAESFLKRLLEGGQPPSVQAEWLHLLARKPARLPERFLPNVLELATRAPPLRASVQSVLGKRGAWLAALEPAWAWTTGPRETDQLQQAWHEGTLEQRVAAFEAWRRVDPAAARAALQSSWSAEPPENRAALLLCLRIGLQGADEAFLEAALDDRRKAVRQAAQRLLASLPGSQLGQRMIARAAPLLQLEKRFLRGTRLAVTPPAERDAAMIRDGIGEVKHPGLGEKAGWLVDVLSAIDPSHWSASLNLAPDECIARSADTDYQEALLLGWTNALQLHLAHAPTPGLLAWLDAWARTWLKTGGAVRYQNASAFVGAYTALPPPAMHAMLLNLVEASHTPWQAADAPLVELLHQLAATTPAPWPTELSHAITRRLLAGLPALATQQWTFRSALLSLAAILDPFAVLDAARPWPGLADDPHGWQGPVDQFFHLVRFRHEMILSFQEPA
ncbi:DUF5691 domain-containing protein [Massilia sp. METH4]|uniref:DUF5691 domain-containing protein n=1 Tax=Massilia sp. METH4 TaxID=3123041 RepID=UPI0030D52921